MRSGVMAAAAWPLALLVAGAAPPAGKPQAATLSGEPAAIAPPVSASAPPLSEGVAQVSRWVVASRDHGKLPFIVIDKVAAEVAVFDRTGAFVGSTPALLGFARGDHSTPGVGDRELSAIKPQDRTTPAGRFVASFGRAYGNRRVLWVDYPTAISLHPVVTAHKKERRPQRLKSPSPDDNRITYGCINVSAAFYEKVVRKLFSRNGGVVYILPETKTIKEAFPAYLAA